MNALRNPPASADANTLHQDLITLLSRFEFVRAELGRLSGTNHQGSALKITLQMIDHLAELAERHASPDQTDEALAAAAALYNEIEQFRKRHTRSGLYSILGLFGPASARAERGPGRRQEYMRVTASATAVLEQFLRLFTPYFAADAGADDWAQAAEAFLADLCQTLAAFQQ